MGDCRLIKRSLVQKCREAGKPETLIRIAIHELESWYLGDLSAVEKGLDLSNLRKKQNSRKYRDPDRLSNPVQEIEKLTAGKYQKVSGSRKIGPYLSLNNNHSTSFNSFISGLIRLIEEKDTFKK